LPPKTKAAITALIQRNKAIWEPFQQGAKLEQARYAIDLNQGFETLLPHLAKVKPAVQLTGLSALLMADSKQPRAATEALLNGLAIAESLKNEPILLSQLVRVAALGLEKTNLEAVVNLSVLPPAELERLAAAFAKAEAEEAAGKPFTRGMGGERVSCLTIMDLPPEQIEAILKKIGGRKGFDGDAVSGTDEKRAIKTLTKNIKAQRGFAEETFNQSIVRRKQPFPDRLTTDQYFLSRVEEGLTNDFQLCLMVMPALGKQTVREATGLTQLRLAQTAIALERFRAANANHYPATLVELTPKFLTAVPQNPFDGQPLQYEKNGEGYELRGAGADSSKLNSFKVVKPLKTS
jgi:hypothetical protein